MSDSIATAHANPAKADVPPTEMAVVLTHIRVVHQGGMTYHVPVGSVIDIRLLPTITTFNPGPDAKLISALGLKIGDIVEA